MQQLKHPLSPGICSPHPSRRSSPVVLPADSPSAAWEEQLAIEVAALTEAWVQGRGSAWADYLCMLPKSLKEYDLPIAYRWETGLCGWGRGGVRGGGGRDDPPPPSIFDSDEISRLG